MLLKGVVPGLQLHMEEQIEHAQLRCWRAQGPASLAQLFALGSEAEQSRGADLPLALREIARVCGTQVRLLRSVPTPRSDPPPRGAQGGRLAESASPMFKKARFLSLILLHLQRLECARRWRWPRRRTAAAAPRCSMSLSFPLRCSFLRESRWRTRSSTWGRTTRRWGSSGRPGPPSRRAELREEISAV